MKLVLSTLATISGSSLDQIGIPFLHWLDETVMPEAHEILNDFQAYIGSWLELLEGETTFTEKVA